ncbi:MAG TPA: outer membrane protein transport protein [Anaeromyxobacter sp.]|nr:outer membrane protein transport protein [Anaeromyxobacter sp.]
MRTLKSLLLLALLLPALALANGYDVPNVNPRDLAMVGSLVAAQNDAEATYANASALARMEGFSLSLAGSMLDLKTSWSAPAGSYMEGSPPATTKFMPAPPVSLFASYSGKLADRGAGVGFGMNIPGGGNVFYDNDWAGRGRIITVDRKLYGFYLNGGIEVIPHLRVGGGATYIHTEEYLKQGVQPNVDWYGELATSGGGWGFNLSAEGEPIPSIPLTIGIDYKHKVPMHLTGNAHFVVGDPLLQPNPANPSAAPPVDQGATHDLTYPNVINVGAAYRVIEPLLVAFTYTYNRYSIYQSDVFVGDKGTTIEVPRHYKDGYTFRLGGEYDLTKEVQLRAGVLRDISGMNVDYYSPTLPDGNVWAGALGAGWKIQPDLTLSGAFFYAWFDTVKQTGTLELPGIYDSRAYIVSLGVTWRTDFGKK